MAAIGKFYYPDVSIDECAELVKVIDSAFEGETSRDFLASKLGHSANSGRLSSKLSALRQFGLIEGHGTIRLTDLGMSLAEASSPQERIAWKFQAILKVPILAQLYDRFNASGVESGALSDSLQTITGLGRSDVERAIPSLHRHLDDVTRWSSTKTNLAFTPRVDAMLEQIPQAWVPMENSPSSRGRTYHFNQSNCISRLEEEDLSETATAREDSKLTDTKDVDPHPTQDNNLAMIKIEVRGARLDVPFTREGVMMAQTFLKSLSPSK